MISVLRFAVCFCVILSDVPVVDPLSVRFISHDLCTSVFLHPLE
jgi:hypothetical protein